MIGSDTDYGTKEIVKEHMPKSMVLKFPKVRAIADCFEMFMEVLSMLTHTSVRFSTYKNYTTVKCSVAIAYDREVVLKSGLLEKRLGESGYECLADRGFTVCDLFEMI